MQFARMAESAYAALDGGESAIEILARFDDDDPVSARSAGQTGAKVIVGARDRVMTRYWNELVPRALGEILMLANDDIVFRTPGWNVLVEAEFAKVPDRIVLVGGDDGVVHGTAIPHPFLSRRWVQTLGYMAAPYFESDYGGDTWNEDVAKALGRRVYLPDLLIEHCHFIYGKAAIDDTARERLARHLAQDPTALYRSLAAERAKDVEKLRAVMTL